MRILYKNHVLLDATNINPLTENPLYPFNTGLKDTRLSRSARTTDDSAQTIVFDFGSAKDVDYVALIDTNFQSGATVTIEANATDAWGAPSLGPTALTRYAGDSYTRPSGDTVSKYDVWMVAASGSYRYWRISINDATNPDTHLDMGACFIGEYLQMPGMDAGQAIPLKSNSIASRSFTGQTQGDRRLKYKSANISFPTITQTEKDDIDDFFLFSDLTTPFILLIWEDDLTVEKPIYATLTKDLDWKKHPLNGLLWTLSLDFTETF
jgi:hypothetical protein